MKNLKTLLVIAAATMSWTALADDATQDPNLVAGPQLGKRTPNVTLSNPSTTYQDPNLIPQKIVAKQTAVAQVASAPAGPNENTLAGTKCQGMPSKTKDSAACAEHCAKFARQ